MGEWIIVVCGGDVNGKRIVIFGLIFKLNMDDMCDSLSFDIIFMFWDVGVEICVYDFEGMEEVKEYL